MMDNLGSHKDKETPGLLESAGVKMRFLPLYSPDYNPIELMWMWSKVKVLLSKAEAREPMAFKGLLDSLPIFRKTTVKASQHLSRLALHLKSNGIQYKCNSP